MNGLPVTQPQIDYVRALQHSLRLPDRMLNDHCVKTFKVPFAQIDRAQCSQLIDELKEWQAIPAELQRAAGQADLPGFEARS